MKVIQWKLKSYLDSRNMTRYALAKKAGIKYQTIDGYYKNAVGDYSNDNLVKILVALDCKIEDLLELVDIPDA